MSVARSSLIMASGTVLSRILGFARSVILALLIGVTTDAADAFGVANQLPNNVYYIIVGGVLNAVLVPQIIKARTEPDGGKNYIDRLLTFIITVFFGITLITTLAAPFLVGIYTSGWSAAQLALATAFAYWCLPQLFFYGLYSLLGEVLNARSAFGPYMWAPVLNNIVGLIGLVAFWLLFGADPTGSRSIDQWDASQIAVLAGGATLGVAAQALILFLAWKKIGLKLNLNFKWRGFGLRPALKAASWSLAMVLITQIGGLVQTVVASGAVAERKGDLAVASVAAAAIAWLVFMLPHSVATVSIATAYFTKMSTHAQEGRIDLLKNDLLTGLRSIMLISVFATAALIVLAYPIARVFAGEFASLMALGNVIIALMLGLVPFSFVYMMQRAFYALEDTRSPFFFTLIQISLHIIGSITLSFVVEAKWLVVSLSLLTSGTVLIQGIIGYLMLRRRIGSLDGRKNASSAAAFIVSGALAGAIGYLLAVQLGGYRADSFLVDSVLTAMLSSLLIGFTMLGVYLIALRLLRVPELKTVTANFQRILRGRK